MEHLGARIAADDLARVLADMAFVLVIGALLGVLVLLLVGLLFVGVLRLRERYDCQGTGF